VVAKKKPVRKVRRSVSERRWDFCVKQRKEMREREEQANQTKEVKSE
jgi:hypothetical protein